MRLTLTLARRFMRIRSLAKTTLITFAAAAFLIGMFVTLKAYTVSGDQVVERDLGRFGARSDVGGVATLDPGDTTLARNLVAAAHKGGATDVMVALTSTEIRPSTVDPPYTPYQEADWLKGPFPRRFLLAQGRWPSRPGEVAVTRPDVLAAGPDGNLSVLAGRARFTVVGVAEDRYANVPTFLAAPGTWAALSPNLGSVFPGLVANPAVFFDGGGRDSVVAAISDTLPRKQHTGTDLAAVTAGVSASTITLDEALATPEPSWIDRIPAAYTVPSLALPALAMLLVFGLNNRRFGRTLAKLTAVGVRPRQAVLAVAGAVVTQALIALSAGVALGLVLGVASRAIVLQFRHQPLPPFPGVAEPILRLAVMTLLGAVVGAVGLRVSLGVVRAPVGTGRTSATTPTPEATKAPRRAKWMHDGRHILAMAGACAAVLQVPRLDSPMKAMLFAGAVAVVVLLLAPDVVPPLLRLLPRRGPRSRLGRQHLLADRNRAVIAVVVLAACLGGPLGFLTLLNTMLQTAEAEAFSDVARGQLALNGRGGPLEPPSTAVLRAVNAGVLGTKPTVQLRYLGSTDTFVSVEGTDFGFVAALDTPDDVNLLFGRDLSQTERSSLAQGGILISGDGSGARPRLVKRSSDDRVLATSDPLPMTTSHLPPVSWRQSIVAVVLTATAQRLDLPTSKGAVFYSGVSDADAAAAQRTVLGAGLDAREVVIHAAPRPVIAPAALYASAAGLLVLLLLTSVAVAGSQVSTLRGYLGTLITIGLPTRWARHVLMLEQAVIIAISTLLALVIAIPPVIVSVFKLPGFVLSIPWSWLALVIGAFYVATFAATLISSRRLRAADRTAT